MCTEAYGLSWFLNHCLPCSSPLLPAQQLAYPISLWSQSPFSALLISFSHFLFHHHPSSLSHSHLSLSSALSFSSPNTAYPPFFFLISHAVSLYITP